MLYDELLIEGVVPHRYLVFYGGAYKKRAARKRGMYMGVIACF